MVLSSWHHINTLILHAKFSRFSRIWVTITGAASGAAPQLTFSGGDGRVDGEIVTQGAGSLMLMTGDGSAVQAVVHPATIYRCIEPKAAL